MLRIAERRPRKGIEPGDLFLDTRVRISSCQGHQTQNERKHIHVMYGGRTTRTTLRRDRIGSNGMISADNQLFSATNAYKGELVDVFVDDTRDPAPIANHPSQAGMSARTMPMPSSARPAI